MKPFELHSAFYNQPIRLADEEKAAPLQVLQDFFQNCPLPTTRQLLWHLTEAALALPDSVFDDASERRHLLWFYRHLETALEAGWLLANNNDKAANAGS